MDALFPLPASLSYSLSRLSARLDGTIGRVLAVRITQYANDLFRRVFRPLHRITFHRRKSLQPQWTSFRGFNQTETPLVGIEPSAILTFRDEYPELVAEDLRPSARALGKNALMLEEFLVREFDAGHISRDAFHAEPREIRLHGHCFQKALTSIMPTVNALQLPQNYKVTPIASGCCGMAGSFGYEAEHYETSQQVGELVLFPTVRSLSEQVIVAAPGTSCRHQIHDATHRRALHPAEVLFEALRSER